MPEKINWRHLSDSTLVSSRPCWLYDLQIEGSAGAGTVTVYDSDRADAAQKVMDVTIAADSFDVVEQRPPVFLENGLYLSLTTVTSVYVRWMNEGEV